MRMMPDRPLAAGKITVGHPVDVAFGTVYASYTDLLVPGKLYLRWERLYDSANITLAPSPLGVGWTSKVFASLTRRGIDYVFRTPEGNDELFHDPDDSVVSGEVIRHVGTFRELRREGDSMVVTKWGESQGKVEKLIFAPSIHSGQWLLKRIQNERGNGLDVFRDQEQRVRQVRQSAERRGVEFDYTDAGDLSTVSFVDAQGTRHVRARYSHDSRHRLISAEDALGYVDRYEYDGESRLVREIVKDGGVFTFRYDEEGRCIRTAGLDRYDEKTFRYLHPVGTTAVTNSLGKTTIYQYLPSGQVTNVIDPVGVSTLTEYDEHGRIIAIVAPNGGRKSYEFDDDGNCCRVTDALGHSYEFTFDGEHRPLARVDPNGAVWRHEYNDRGALTRTTDPLGATWTIEYDGDGNPVAQTNPLGYKKTARFDSVGDMVAVTDFTGVVTHFQCDLFGRVVKKTGDAGDETEVVYDALDNPIQVRFPDGSTLGAEYDAGGNPTRIVDENGETATYVFGPCGRLLQRVDRRGERVQYHWTTEPDLLASITNEKGEIHRFIYDDAGRVVEEWGFDGRHRVFRYGPSGDLTGIEDGNGHIQRRAYDLCGRLSEQVGADGSFNRFTYDETGNLISGVTAETSVSLVVDLVGQVVAEVQDVGSVEREFNAAGDLTDLTTTLGGSIRYVLDANGLPTAIAAGEAEITRFRRNGRGQVVSRKLAQGLELEQVYDIKGRLSEQRVRSDSRPAFDRVRVYRHDGRDSVTECREPLQGVTSQYRYDAGERMVLAVLPEYSESYERDAVGNATRVFRSGAVGSEPTVLEYGPGARVVRCGETVLSYDAEGQLTRRVEYSSGARLEWEFTWDGLHQLRAVRRPDGSTWSYVYDAFGRRVEKVGPSTRIQYVWDQNVVLHEIENEGPAVTWLFDTGDASPLGRFHAGRFQSITWDHLGRPRELRDDGGTVLAAFQYHSNGRLRHTDGQVPCPPRFQGQWEDPESGLHYNRFRYYDPVLGRFISPDPIDLRGGLDLFAFGLNPINWYDPFGLETCYVVRNPPETGPVVYVGITKQPLEDRQAQHRDIPGRSKWQLEPVASHDAAGRPLSHDAVKGIEQGLIDHYGLEKNGGKLKNEINSMSCDNDKLKGRLKKGDKYVDEFLEKEGEKRQRGKCPRT